MSNTQNTQNVLVVDRRELKGIRASKKLMSRLREIQANRLQREIEKCQKKPKT